MYHSQDKLRNPPWKINSKACPSWDSTGECNKVPCFARTERQCQIVTINVLVMKESRNLSPSSDILKQSLPVRTRAANSVAQATPLQDQHHSAPLTRSTSLRLGSVVFHPNSSCPLAILWKTSEKTKALCLLGPGIRAILPCHWTNLTNQTVIRVMTPSWTVRKSLWMNHLTVNETLALIPLEGFFPGYGIINNWLY